MKIIKCQMQPFTCSILMRMPNSTNQQQSKPMSKAHYLPLLCLSRIFFRSLFYLFNATSFFSARILVARSMAACLSILPSMFSAVFLTLSSAQTIAPAISSNSLSFSSNSLSRSLSAWLRPLSSSFASPFGAKPALDELREKMSTNSLFCFFFSLLVLLAFLFCSFF